MCCGLAVRSVCASLYVGGVWRWRSRLVILDSRQRATRFSTKKSCCVVCLRLFSRVFCWFQIRHPSEWPCGGKRVRAFGWLAVVALMDADNCFPCLVSLVSPSAGWHACAEPSGRSRGVFTYVVCCCFRISMHKRLVKLPFLDQPVFGPGSSSAV